MKTIWKFPLSLDEYQAVTMPEDAEILHVGVQGSVPHIWAMVDTTAPVKVRHIYQYGTGIEVEGRPLVPPTYLGTVQIDFEWGGPFVAHYFERHSAP